MVSQPMRTNLSFDFTRRSGLGPVVPSIVYRLGAASGRDDDEEGDPSPGSDPVEREDLPYKVELWNDPKTAVEQVLAVTANGSIGYAAFYGATREFPNRYITLRHKSTIVSRWNGPRH